MLGSIGEALSRIFKLFLHMANIYPNIEINFPYPDFYNDAWTNSKSFILNVNGVNKSYCYIKQDVSPSITDSQLATEITKILQSKGIANDLSFLEDFYPFKGATNYNGRLDIYYLGQNALTNIPRNETNVFANDAGLKIRIPPPKVDKSGKVIRRFVKVTRLSHETLSPLISKSVSLQKVTEIIQQNFSYPLSSIVGMKLDSRSFSQIPSRTFECKLKKVLVPSNYFPLNDKDEDHRYLMSSVNKAVIYAGDWDGTFKFAWTNNPAWIIMDMLVNKRYGLGNYIESEQVDIWELYKIARWCDAVDENGIFKGVPNGLGGIEPRHAFNAVIQEKFNIFDMINQIASVFKGNVYYMNSLITFSAEMPKPPVGEFTNSDVKDGLFNYTNLKKDEEFTAVDVTFVDEKNNYKPAIEYVEDSDGIRKRGILKKEINAFGVTSRAQAKRVGKHFLHHTAKENLNVNFTTDMRALLYKPGDIIRIHDELLSSYKNYGKILSIENVVGADALFKITIDKHIESGIYDTGSITLYTPLAKPKYEDMASYSEFVPTSVNLVTNNSPIGNILTKFITDDDPSLSAASVPSLTLTPYRSNPNNWSFSGKFKQQFTQPPSTTPIDKSINIYSFYKEGDLYGVPSQHGHWEIKTGDYEIDSLSTYSGRRIILDSVLNEEIKIQSPHKKYFFEYFDSGRFVNLSGTGIGGTLIYTGYYFNPESNAQYIKFNTVEYKKPEIAYSRILENDRPSIESFQIFEYLNSGYTGENGVLLNKYSEVKVFKKREVPNVLDFFATGSAYSINVLNKNVPNFRILSITENYINEYDIFATQFDQNKFAEIEESQVDNLGDTFNALYGYTSAKSPSVDDLLKTPILQPIQIFEFESNKYLNITWNLDTNDISSLSYLRFKISIQTPSRQTSNFEIDNLTFDQTYDKNSNLFVYNAFKVAREEVGTYIVQVQTFYDEAGMYKFSTPAKRSFYYLNY